MSPQRASRLFALTCPLRPSRGVQSRPSLATPPGGPGARGRTRRRAEGAAGPPPDSDQMHDLVDMYITTSQRHFTRSLYTHSILTRTPVTSWERCVMTGLHSCSGPSLLARSRRCHAQNCLRELTPGPAPATRPRPPPLFISASASRVSAASRHIVMLLVE